MARKASRDQHRHSVEEEQGFHFMQWVTNREPTRVVRLDWKTDRKRPDFAFYYQSGQRYTLELTSWLSPVLKELQDFLQINVADPLLGTLAGTFALYIPLEKLPNGRMVAGQAAKLVLEIQSVCGPGASYTRASDRMPALCLGMLHKIRDEGQRLVPIITFPETVYLDETSKLGAELKDSLSKILSEAEGKFRWYKGVRVLVLDISQNGLDIDYHAGRSKEGPGIVNQWVVSLLGRRTPIHYVCLSPGMRVWGGDGYRRMLTGHKYEGQITSNYREVWHKPGLPTLLASFIP
jgi:hypothetical protein